MIPIIKDRYKLIYIGIDPGKTGCAAAVSANMISLHEWASPMAAKDWIESVISSGNIGLAVIEHNDQRYLPQKGRIGAYDLGYACGVWLGLCSGLCVPFRLIRATEWQRAMIGPHIISKNPKHKSLIAAISHDKRLGHVLARVKDHNRADALNMAFYAQMCHQHELRLKKLKMI